MEMITRSVCELVAIGAILVAFIFEKRFVTVEDKLLAFVKRKLRRNENAERL